MDRQRGRYSSEIDFDIVLNLEAIEQEIAQLWHPDARGDDPITSLATRANVLNLIIYAPDDETAQRAQDASEKLSRIHPCRVILFRRAQQSARGRLSPDIFATCEAGGDNPEAPCIERISIPVSRQMYSQLPNLVQPLIIPELPAYLWWPEAPAVSDPTFVAMARGANLTVIDSNRFASARSLTELVELDELLPSRAAIADLNWQRLQPWRELTAQFFDIRSVHWALSCIREVEIDVGRISGNALPSQALLFAAWLAHCLDWAPIEARRTRNDRWYIGLRDPRGDDVRIIIRSRPCHDAGRGHLLALSINAQNHLGETSSLSLSRGHESPLIRMHARSGLDSRLHHAVYHPHLPEEALLTPILESTMRDLVYDASLAKAVTTLEMFAKPEAT